MHVDIVSNETRVALGARLTASDTGKVNRTAFDVTRATISCTFTARAILLDL